MGTWSASILGGDVACDVHSEFMESYDNGKDLKLIRRELEQGNARLITDPDNGPDFWLALAQAQWECGVLESDVRGKVKEIVEQGLGLAPWAEGTAPDLQERRKVLRDFWTCIQTPPTAVCERTARKEHPPIFAPGVCLSVQLPNGDFGAAIVLGANHEHREFGMNLVGLLAYRSEDKPALSVFESRRWLKTVRWGRFRKKELLWLFAHGFAASAQLFEHVATVKLRWLDPKNSKSSAPQWSIVPTIISQAIPKTGEPL